MVITWKRPFSRKFSLIRFWKKIKFIGTSMEVRGPSLHRKTKFLSLASHLEVFSLRSIWPSGWGIIINQSFTSSFLPICVIFVKNPSLQRFFLHHFFYWQRAQHTSKWKHAQTDKNSLNEPISYLHSRLLVLISLFIVSQVTNLSTSTIYMYQL